MLRGQRFFASFSNGYSFNESDEVCEELMRRDENRKSLRDLIVIDVCISCDDYPFLDSCLWHSSFHRLTVRKQKEDSQISTHTHTQRNKWQKSFWNYTHINSKIWSNNNYNSIPSLILDGWTDSADQIVNTESIWKLHLKRINENEAAQYKVQVQSLSRRDTCRNILLLQFQILCTLALSG